MSLGDFLYCAKQDGQDVLRVASLPAPALNYCRRQLLYVEFAGEHMIVGSYVTGRAWPMITNLSAEHEIATFCRELNGHAIYGDDAIQLCCWLLACRSFQLTRVWPTDGCGHAAEDSHVAVIQACAPDPRLVSELTGIPPEIAAIVTGFATDQLACLEDFVRVVRDRVTDGAACIACAFGARKKNCYQGAAITRPASRHTLPYRRRNSTLS